MKQFAMGLMASAVVLISSPALAQSSTVATSGKPISAVYDANEIAMAPLPGGRGNLGFEADPAFFAGANLCVSGRDDNWAIRRDGTLDTYNKARRASCAPIGPDGHVSVPNPFGPSAVPFIERDGRMLAWAGRDRLTGGLVD